MVVNLSGKQGGGLKLEKNCCCCYYLNNFVFYCCLGLMCEL